MCRGNTNLKLHETPTKGVWVEGLTECYVSSADEALNIIEVGDKCRSVAHTQVRLDTPKSFFGPRIGFPFFLWPRNLGRFELDFYGFLWPRKLGCFENLAGLFS